MFISILPFSLKGKRVFNNSIYSHSIMLYSILWINIHFDKSPFLCIFFLLYFTSILSSVNYWLVNGCRTAGWTFLILYLCSTILYHIIMYLPTGLQTNITIYYRKTSEKRVMIRKIIQMNVWRNNKDITFALCGKPDRNTRKTIRAHSCIIAV